MVEYVYGKERKNPMVNVAYSQEYRTYRQEQERVFCADYLRHSKTTMIFPHYYLKKCSYSGKVGGYTLHATENELIDETGKVLYTWKNLNDDCEFCELIEHGNGHEYLVFRSDLYGYSVLDLDTLQDFHYIPSGSFPKGETFIWTDVSYNKKTNLIAVSGCYWACPFGTLLMDFSHPMKEPGIWADVQEHLENGYDRYDDVDFMEWRNTDLVLCAFNNQTENRETILITEHEYIKWLSEK
ncbi:hypothetical protein CBFG_00982 [Clostridiales bacterium 1_7_47FAA]|nr:hypothetical protein CBFG_00982 [Clostridiales bacterium 1_7_47FAA]